MKTTPSFATHECFTSSHSSRSSVSSLLFDDDDDDDFTTPDIHHVDVEILSPRQAALPDHDEILSRPDPCELWIEAKQITYERRNGSCFTRCSLRGASELLIIHVCVDHCLFRRVRWMG